MIALVLLNVKALVLGIVFGVLGLILLIIFLSSIKVVSQGMEYIIEGLGKYKETWGAGIHFKIPFYDRIASKVILKEQVLDSNPQPVITKDNVTIMIDSVNYFYVFDSKAFTYGVVNPLVALDNLIATTLRNIIGTMTLDDTLISRDVINNRMAVIVDEATDKWGIKVTRCEVKNIMLPKEIQTAMEKQMKAEREKREAILLAEAHQESVIKRAEGDKQARILDAEGKRDAEIALAEGNAKAILLRRKAEAESLRILSESHPSQEVIELKRFEALVEVAKGNATKIIVPSDISSMASKSVLTNEIMGFGDETKPGKPTAPSSQAADLCCDAQALDEHKKAVKDDPSLKKDTFVKK